MRILGLCQGANLEIFEEFCNLISSEEELEKIGIFVADAFYFKNNYEKKKLPIKGVFYLKEWETIKKGLSRSYNQNYLDEKQKLLGAPSLRYGILADRRLIFGKYCKSTQSYKTKFSNDQLLGILEETIVRVESFLDEIKPDVIIGFAPVTLHEYIFLRYAEKRQIKVRLLRSLKIKNFVTFFDSLYGLPKKIKNIIDDKQYTFSTESVQDIEEYLNQTIASGANYEGMHQTDYSLASFNILRIFLGLFSSIKNEMKKFFTSESRNDNHNPGFMIPYLYDQIINPIRAKRTRKFIKKIYGQKLDTNQKYCFYPMHFEPEIALQLYARPIQNQIEIIRTISNALPPGQVLVVKEHPRSAGHRKLSYYKKLSEIPNIILFGPEYSSRKLVENSEMVITITGNIASEALILKKPLIILGDSELYGFPESMLKKCHNLFNLSDDIFSLQSNFHYEQDKVNHYFRSLISGGAKIDLYSTLLGKKERLTFSEASKEQQLKAFKLFLLNSIR